MSTIGCQDIIVVRTSVQRVSSLEMGAFARFVLSSRRTPMTEMIVRPGNIFLRAGEMTCCIISAVQNRRLALDQGPIKLKTSRLA